MSSDYRVLNRASWDERASAHAASSDYAFGRFASDPGYLSDVVTFSPRRCSVEDSSISCSAVKPSERVISAHGSDALELGLD